jgi:two-component system chemotaxis response regulator CheB
MKQEATIRVLVVDDSALMRKVLVKMLEKEQGIEVVGTAMDGVFALEKIDKLRPDVVTLDLEMPRMDGLTALRQIVERFQTPVVLVSAHAAKGAAITFEALAAGGVDFVAKPERILSAPLEPLGEELARKIRMASRVSVAKLRHGPVNTASPADDAERKPRRQASEYVLAIGVSTGGPNALAYLLPQLRADFPAAVLVVQHMPAGFTALFAKRVGEISALEVREAAEGDPIVPGRVLIAPGDRHMKVRCIEDHPVVSLSRGEPVGGLRPSVDVMLRSVAEVFGRKSIALIMTGMGDDGAEGMAVIKSAGGLTLAQDKGSSIVYGMPKAAADRGAVDRVLSLHEMGDFLNNLSVLKGRGEIHEVRREAANG